MRALQIEVVMDEAELDNFTHLVGTKYLYDETRHEYINTHITLYDGLIVAYRAPVRSNGETGNEEKSPIHIADVIKMMGRAEKQDKIALEYWREQRKTMDNGRVNNRILITKSSICADKRKARETNTSECTAPTDKIPRVGSGKKWG